MGRRSRGDARRRASFAHWQTMILVDTSIRIAVFRKKAAFRIEDTIEFDEIAACALRHDLPVLHMDRDYELLSRVSTLTARSVK